MNIALRKPPIFDEAEKHFGAKEWDVIYYTYGNTIFSPSKRLPSDDLIAHEEVHADQQGHSDEGAAEWWRKVFADPVFRADQEAEAYGAQLRFLKRQKRFHDPAMAAKMLHQMASSLSGPTYGKCVSYAEAAKTIKAYADGSAIADIEKLMPDVDLEI